LRRLIVTGDDFGFSRGVNRAIIEAHERGVLTSASLMVAGEASAEAVELARAHPTLAVGLHLVVVDGRPVLPAREVPHLVGREGRLPARPVRMGLAYQVRPAARRELASEIRAQLERFRETGLTLSHVDGHHHMHLHPFVLRRLLELSQEFGIPAIRLPSEELGVTLALDRSGLFGKLAGTWVFRRLRKYGERKLRAAGVRFPERVYGLLATGRMTESYVLGLLPRIRANFAELYFHPAVALAGEPLNGPPGSGSAELAALVSARVRHALDASGFALTSYRDSR
jgi:hopanoid biosynthesis associated protein HpnK